MSQKNKRISKPGSAPKATGSNLSYQTAGAEMFDMMSNAGYLRQSSTLINDALQKGFDVLQLADGDIVLTGTKTVVYRYTWDADSEKLTKSKTETSSNLKRPKRMNVEMEEDEDEDA